MYEEFFRLTDAPFRLNPDPRFFYGSRSHNKAMAYLHYGLKQAEGFIVITGPVGAGKSMIIGHLLDQLNASNVVAANLLTSNIEPQDLLSQVLSAFRIEPEGEGRTGEIEAFEDYLFDQLNRGRRVLLIIDEAQNLPFKTLEELRMLSNIDYEGTPLFQVFLVGQPEFRTMIESDRLEQLRQRVIASYHLEQLTEEETRDYIQHRLSVAGWKDDPAFLDEAYTEIYKETGGLPRRINTLTNRVMLFCSLEETHEVTGKIVKRVCEELKEEKLAAKKAANPTPAPEKVDDTPAKEEAKMTDAPPKPPKKKKQEVNDKQADKEDKSGVVITIDSVREQSSKNAPAATDNQSPQAQENNRDDPATDIGVAQVMSSSMSVLDRLRAKKSTASVSTPEERQEATLNDVATAIAAATNGAEQNDQPTAAANSQELDQLRKNLTKSVEETREELKEAHANISHLKKATAGSLKARKDRREEISDHLSRAETLLNHLREKQEQ